MALLEVFDVEPADVEPADVVDQMEYDEEGNFIESTYVPPMSLIDPMYSDFDWSGMTLKVPGKYDLDVSKAK